MAVFEHQKEGRHSQGRVKFWSLWIALGLIALFIGINGFWEESADARGPEVPGIPAGAGASVDEEIPRLYQLLHDEHFTAPMDDLGQKVRIWIWLDWMAFDISQLRRLQRLGERFQVRVRDMQGESERLLGEYESQLVVHYETLYDVLRQENPDPEALEAIAKRLSVAALSSKRDEALRELRIQTLKTIMSDEKDFLYTLSPEQEQRLVSSLFFLRNEIDPFTNPGTYRNIIGPTWNAGDFTALMRNNKGDDHLNIGGLWGFGQGQKREPNYGHIKRQVVLFYVLKEPMLAETAGEMLELRLTQMRRAADLKKSTGN